MNSTDRRREIFNIIQADKSVEVNQLAKKFAVSTMTIRRDLTEFEKQGVVTTTYGGAYLNKGVSIEPDFFLRTNQMLDKKQMIARAAIKHIDEGDTIIIDSGTTTLELVKLIPDKKIKIITNSWPVAYYLKKRPNVTLILAPGEYDHISAGTFSGQTIAFFKQFNADKVFMGTHGFDIRHGATVPEILDGDVKKALLDAGKTKFLLADSGKYNHSYLVTHARLELFDYLIVDDSIGEENARSLSGVCKHLIIAENDC